MLSPQEWHQRYTLQARWTADLRHYLFSQVHLESARAVLEVGCGSGVIAADTQQYTPAAVFGIDLRPDILSVGKQAGAAPRCACANVFSLPFSQAAFDITFCHFLLLWLEDAALGLSEMCRVTRPGGAVLALAEPDYGGRIDHPAPLVPLGRLQAEALLQQGADPQMGRKLSGLFYQAGLKNVQTGLLGGQWRELPSPQSLASEWLVLQADLEGLISPARLADLRHVEETAWAAGQRVLFVPTFYALGFVP